MISFVIYFILFAQVQNILWPDPYDKTLGRIWPLPMKEELYEKIWSIDKKNFEIESDYKCDILEKAIQRYMKRIFPEWTNDKKRKTNEDALTRLIVRIGKPCPNGVPQFEMNESYKLFTTNETATLEANEIWGALRGFESFSHMVYHVKDEGNKIRSAVIKDYPRFLHRGVLLDTGRHYLSINSIKATIDLMSQNKFNVFHWHIVDNEAFPYVSKRLPKFSKGAFRKDYSYTIDDIKEIISYARLRGIRVMVEFDLPGHTNSWGRGYPELLAECFKKDGSKDNDQSLIDPTKEETWDIIKALFEEINEVFPEDYLHIGGDEVSFWSANCWDNNPNITKFMKIHGIGSSIELQTWFIKNLRKSILDRYKQKRYVYWQEIFDESDHNLKDSIIQIWKGSVVQSMEYVKAVTESGNMAIYSSCWYLSTLSSSIDWMEFYKCDPQNFNGTDSQKHLVIGGEAALWGEFIDDSNVVPVLWPRASAVAEKLWSSAKDTKNLEGVWPRLYEMMCRMKSRGYPAHPINGPSFCEYEYKNNLPTEDL